MKPAPDLRSAHTRTLDVIARQPGRAAKSAVAVSAVLTPAGLLKPVWGDSGAKAPRRGDPRKVVSPPPPMAPPDLRPPRVRRGVPVCNLPVNLAALDAAPSPDRAADMDDEGLRRLGAEIIVGALDILRRPRPTGPVTPKREEARRRELAARSSEAEFIRGDALDRCVTVFGVRVDPDAVRRGLHLSRVDVIQPANARGNYPGLAP